jgi:hypothetical protein
MKKLLLIVGIVGAVVVGGSLLIAYNAGSIVTAMKPQLEQVASDALGAKVTLGNLDLSIFPSTRITVDELSVAGRALEDPTVADRPREAVTLKNVTLHVRLLPLLKKRLEIVELSLVEPVITLVKEPTGIRVAGLPEKTAPKAGASAPTTETAGGEAAAGIELALERFKVTNASIELDDRVAKSKATLASFDFGTGLDLSGNKVRFDNLVLKGAVTPPSTSGDQKAGVQKLPFSVEIPSVSIALDQLALELPKLIFEALDTSFEAAANLKLLTVEGDLKLGSKGINLSALSSNPALPPAIGALGLTGTVVPQFSLSLKGLTSAGKPNLNLSGTVGFNQIGAVANGVQLSALQGGLDLSGSAETISISTKELGGTINGEQFGLQTVIGGTLNDVTIKPLTLSGFGGTISAEVKLGLHGAQPVSVSGNAAGLDIGRVMRAGTGSDGNLTGNLQQLRYNLNAALADPKGSAEGTVALTLKDATLKGTNIATSVLQAVKGIPFLSGSLLDAVPADEQNSNNTAISSATGNFRIGSASVRTDDFVVVSPLFTLTASGRAGFDTSLDLRASIVFTEKFSATLASKMSEVQRLFDDKKRLVVPLQIQGTTAKPLILPEIEKLIKLGATKALQDNAGKLLGDVLGGKKGKGSASGLGGLLGL